MQKLAHSPRYQSILEDKSLLFLFRFFFLFILQRHPWLWRKDGVLIFVKMQQQKEPFIVKALLGFEVFSSNRCLLKGHFLAQSKAKSILNPQFALKN